MHRFMLVVTAAVSVAGFIPAEGDETMPSRAPAIRTVPGSTGSVRADGQQRKTDEKKLPTRRERLIQLVKDQNQDWQDRVAAVNGMRPGAERDKATEALQTAGFPFARKALDLAREDDKDEIAFSAAFFAFTGGTTETMTDAADFISHHLANDMKVVPAMPQLVHTRGGLDLLARLAENTTSKAIRGAALFAMLDAEVDRIESPSPGMPLSANDVAAKYAAAARKLKRLAADFAGVKVSTRLGDSVSEAARRKLYFIDHLTIGKRAPDFECELLSGRKARLSDFR